MKPLFGGFGRCTAPLAHADGWWFFVMHRAVGAYRWMEVFCDALRRWRIPKGNGFFNGGCRWLAGGFYAELFLWGLF